MTKAKAILKFFKFPLTFRNSLLIALGVHVASAWFSQGFYQYDEHFQILEFLGYKLGFVSADQLQWEFANGLRSFAQPFVYYLFVYPLSKLSITDSHFLAFFCRLLSSVSGCLGFYLFLKEIFRDFRSQYEKNFILWATPFIFFLPFFQARTSSENFTTTAILFSAGFLLRYVDSREKIGNFILFSLFAFASFVFRYQSAFLVIGMYAWLVYTFGFRWREFVILALAGITVEAAELAVNYWGYGTWVFTPWQYFDFNILRGVASGFGTSPWYGYVPLLKEEFGILVAIVVIVTGALALYTFRRSLAVWMVVPFLAAHILMAHKEIRFLFPCAVLLMPYLVAILSYRRARKLLPILAVLNFALLIKWSFLPQKDQIAIAKEISAKGTDRSQLVCFGEDLYHIKPLDLHWYRPNLSPRSQCEMPVMDLPTYLQKDAGGDLLLYIRFSTPQEFLAFAVPPGFSVVSEDLSLRFIKWMGSTVSDETKIKLLRGRPLRIVLASKEQS